MRCQLEVCRAVGAGILVYHSGLQALDQVQYGVRPTLLSDEELLAGAAQEVAALRELAPVAANAGVIIGMENGDSHQWEHTLLAQFDRPRADLSQHHARLHIPPIVRQLEAIDHPNVAMTLDIAHLHIAAHDMGFDYLAAIEQAAPWVNSCAGSYTPFICPLSASAVVSGSAKRRSISGNGRTSKVAMVGKGRPLATIAWTI